MVAFSEKILHDDRIDFDSDNRVPRQACCQDVPATTGAYDQGSSVASQPINQSGDGGENTFCRLSTVPVLIQYLRAGVGIDLDNLAVAGVEDRYAGERIPLDELQFRLCPSLHIVQTQPVLVPTQRKDRQETGCHNIQR